MAGVVALFLAGLVGVWMLHASIPDIVVRVGWTAFVLGLAVWVVVDQARRLSAGEPNTWSDARAGSLVAVLRLGLFVVSLAVWAWLNFSWKGGHPSPGWLLIVNVFSIAQLCFGWLARQESAGR